MNNTFDSHAPLSRRLALSEVPPEGLDVDIRATPLECAALAQLNALPAVHSLQAKLRARQRRGDGLEIEGELRARIRQICVTTLEEFDSELIEPIQMRFAPPRDEAPRNRRRHEETTEITLDEDPPDPLIGGVVDLGAVVSEFFTLALDPYPRKPGANFVEPQPGDGAQAVSAFAALGRLKPRREA
ncbi:DUF177 domain-containing protein [Methylocystis sp. H4A]|uniref:YceD family protein n=1 Tax=Methylocystis sp. H4A TaxID=2785788 RepID=UPI0018C20FE6|nr:DUF177 domain-containing protein [Methylocystis sp. H4A]MBG0803545.1 DUF177 domain-containing protein [Methylocystis sp. H4A]